MNHLHGNKTILSLAMGVLLLSTLACAVTDSPAVNAHPRTAWAEVDARLLPSTSPDDFLAAVVEAIADPKVTVRVLLSAKGEPESPETGLFSIARRVLRRRFPGAAICRVGTLAAKLDEIEDP